MALVGAAAAFGAACAVLALMGMGVPFLLAALLAAGCAGLLVYAAGRWVGQARPTGPPAPPTVLPGPDLEERIRQLEESSAHLRHDLRGVLSPALMMADRLLKSDDPAIRRAGNAVVRSVERATTLLAENKRQIAAAAARAEMAGAGSPPRSPVAGSGAPAP
jgi:signal transduction histidine kinase